MSSWHVERELIGRFVDNDPLDHVTAASIEQHLTTCSQCQGLASERTAPDVLDRVWSGVAEHVDRSESDLAERWLVRAGLEPGPARLVGATPALRVATLAAVVLVVAVMVWASQSADAAGVFLALAPVVPTALVAMTFAANADPGGESGMATPEYGFPLLLRRAVAVELLALAILAAGACFVSLDGLRAVAWLLPATALSASTVAAGVRWSTTNAAMALLAGWFGAIAVGEVVDGRRGGPPLAEAPVFGVPGQLVALAILVVSVAVVYSHRHSVFQEVTR